MSESAIYVKTTCGAEEVQARSRGLPPRLRTMLIMVDGVRTAAQLDMAAATLGAPADFLASLERLGLVQARGERGVQDGSARSDLDLVLEVGSRAPEASDPERFLTAQKLMNDSVVDALGLRAIFLILKIEKAATCDELRLLMPTFRKAIAKGSGEDAAGLLETRVLSILG